MQDRPLRRPQSRQTGPRCTGSRQINSSDVPAATHTALAHLLDIRTGCICRVITRLEGQHNLSQKASSTTLALSLPRARPPPPLSALTPRQEASSYPHPRMHDRRRTQRPLRRRCSPVSSGRRVRSVPCQRTATRGTEAQTCQSPNRLPASVGGRRRPRSLPQH